MHDQSAISDQRLRQRRALLLPALDVAPIVHMAVANVFAECTAVAHVVEHDPPTRIVDYKLTAEHQMISKGFIRIFCARDGCTEQIAQHQ
jgi:hypothetical protein